MLSSDLHDSKWPFFRGEITAGLRKHLNKPDLVVTDIWEEVLFARPSQGRIRGMMVEYISESVLTGKLVVLKEPYDSTKAGLAGVGRREVGVYRWMTDTLPVATPSVIAADKIGHWMVLDALPIGLTLEYWQGEHYLDAVYNLAKMHHRFWQLESDLNLYKWMSRPFHLDTDVFIKSARTSFDKFLARGLVSSDEHLSRLILMLNNAEKIAGLLSKSPQTFIHGDYWPGNISIDANGDHVLYDWQLAGIAPGILDVVNLIQKSRWEREVFPVHPVTLVKTYRREIQRLTGYTVDQTESLRELDCAIMWQFMTEWLGRLANSPQTLLEDRKERLVTVWLDPLMEAIERQLT